MSRRSEQGRSNRRRGVEWERAIAAYLRAAGLPVDRTPTGRHDDAGDLDGLPGWLVEAKNHQRAELGPWLDTATRKATAGGRRAVLVVKRRQRPAREAFVVMTLETFAGMVGDEHDPGPITVEGDPAEPRVVVR